MKEQIIKAIIIDFREHDMEEPTFSVREIKNSLATLQGIVGGNIEIPCISEELYKRGIDVIINEEGKLINLKTSMFIVDKETNEILDAIKGNVIFTSHDDNGNTTSLNEEQIEFLSNLLENSIVIFSDGEESGIAYTINA